jgi:lipopolysaccharide biosynthesis glycosyltransferase
LDAVELRAEERLLGRKSFMSGSMVITADRLLLQNTVDAAPKLASLYVAQNLPFRDQNILNHYVSDWPTRDELHLSRSYDVFWGDFDALIREKKLSMSGSNSDKLVKVIHFTGKRKPWFNPVLFLILSVLRPLKNQRKFPTFQTLKVIQHYLVCLRKVNKRLALLDKQSYCASIEP